MGELFGFVGGAVLVVLCVLILAAIVALPMMWIVNYLFSTHALVAVFGIPKIGFWKAFWLAVFFWLVTASSVAITHHDDSSYSYKQ
ncbi:MAG: hypothetical protein HYT94_02935 [Parcubacteria group bacterium]|nr:hypothetical protein [Parcubacteria group bacterium]